MVPEELRKELGQYDIASFDEVSLREALEGRVETYTVYKLAPWPARRWKCHYRIMMGSGTYDGQHISEAYARALLATFQDSEVSTHGQPPQGAR